MVTDSAVYDNVLLGATTCKIIELVEEEFILNHRIGFEEESILFITASEITRQPWSLAKLVSAKIGICLDVKVIYEFSKIVGETRKNIDLRGYLIAALQLDSFNF